VREGRCISLIRRLKQRSELKSTLSIRSCSKDLCSDVRRGQNLEAETEVEAKGTVMNKKYQMLANDTQANLYHYDQNDTLFRHTLFLIILFRTSSIIV